MANPPENIKISRPGVQKKVALLIIGAEVLSAKIEDKNSPFLAQALRRCGAKVTEIRTIDDDKASIISALTTLRATNDFVITTGGIGATHDDITIESIAEALGVGLTHHPDFIKRLNQKYGKALSPRMRRLAQIPEGTRLLSSPDTMPYYWGTFFVENIFILPGIPSFVRTAFSSIQPWVEGPLVTTLVLRVNSSEVSIGDTLDTFQSRYANDIAIGSYPKRDEEAGRWYVDVTIDGIGQTYVTDVRHRLADALNSLGIKTLLLEGEK